MPPPPPPVPLSVAAAASLPPPVKEPEIHSLQGVSILTERENESTSNNISPPPTTPPTTPSRRKFVVRERAVPSNSFTRAFGFAGLGASLLFGSAKDSISRAWRGNDQTTTATTNSTGGGTGGNQSTQPNVYSSFLSESNAERLAEALCRMRGAALKLGQMLSIQDEAVM